jgi:NodT family efflux transporter outer membrane factor (OMF) lipoprotein
MTRALASLALIALAACAAPPPPQPVPLRVELPAQWVAAGDRPAGAARDLWWQEFADPQLNALVDEAIAHNHDLRAAAARVDAAAAQASSAGAYQWPWFGAGFDASRQRRNFIGLPFPGGGTLHKTFTSYGVGLSASWELDLWGRLRAGEAATLAELQASAADLRAAQHSLAAQTARAWFALLESRLQVELAERSVESFRQTADLVRGRFALGVRPALDVRLAESDLASARALLEQRKEQQALAVRQLEILLGRYPGGALQAAPDLPAMPPAVPAGLPADLLTRRPDLVAAERRAAAGDRRLAAATAALYPRIALTATAGTATQELGDLLDPDFFVWSLVGNLTQPLFEGGRLRAEVAREEALLRELAEGYASVALVALHEVESALATEQTFADRERHLQRATLEAGEARLQSQDRYLRGLENSTTLLDAQRRALTAEAQWLTARRLRLDNRIDLHLALGGGFPLEPAGEPAPTR